MPSSCLFCVLYSQTNENRRRVVFSKGACQRKKKEANLTDAQINTQEEKSCNPKASYVIITALSCSLRHINEDFSHSPLVFSFFISPPPLTAQLGDLVLIASKKLWKNNKCFSSWYNCVCRNGRRGQLRRQKASLHGKRFVLCGLAEKEEKHLE